MHIITGGTKPFSLAGIIACCLLHKLTGICRNKIFLCEVGLKIQNFGVRHTFNFWPFFLHRSYGQGPKISNYSDRSTCWLYKRVFGSLQYQTVSREDAAQLSEQNIKRQSESLSRVIASHSGCCWEVQETTFAIFLRNTEGIHQDCRFS